MSVEPEPSGRQYNGAETVRPRVSVVIPVYNHAGYLSEAVQSVLDQTYRDFEVIVVDDGSSDNCREVAACFGNRIRYIWQENQGLGGARNTGILAADGDLIGLLDADDQWRSTFLETMVSLADQWSDAAIYYCCAQGMDAGGRDVAQDFGGPVRQPEEMQDVLLRANFLIPSTVMMRRSTVVQAGLFEQSNRAIHGCEDWDLWLRVVPEHRFIGTSDCLVRYRLHANTFSANPQRMQAAVKAVIEKQFGPDDGQWDGWSRAKRRAYGGVYRYLLISSTQHQDDLQTRSSYMHRALQVDPSLATDLDLFYDLAMCAQPIGQRGTAEELNLDDSAHQMAALLSFVFESADMADLLPLNQRIKGTANFALGLLAYNTHQFAVSRRFLVKALRYRPDLWQDPRVSSNLLKTFAGATVVSALRRFRQSSPSPTTGV